MADYPPNEIIDMVMVLGECHNNYRAAARLYVERFPLRRRPNHMTTRRLTERARGGHLTRERRRHEYNETDPRVVTVLAAIHLDPHISSRRIEREIGIPRRTALRILRNLKYHAYHITLLRQNRGAGRVRANVEERILEVFEENPRNSIRRVAHTLGISPYAVHRTLRENGLHPYHFQRVQQLLARDEEPRICFCEGIFIIFIKYFRCFFLKKY
ncbi:hypothetical protein ALC57_12166 [Trachymyrmex cornetzi]|uniref:DUF4817 domain-containing protein n=1 Tax=Trachymyrmex cornetzi TaxID=471704 RepID=A0A195DS37_9HYME|nr:hypothetical protein ALC57_12166 [Trachymyrmex cornetzi]